MPTMNLLEESYDYAYDDACCMSPTIMPTAMPFCRSPIVMPMMMHFVGVLRLCL